MSVLGPTAEDFGADEMTSSPNEYGGEHITAYSKSGGQISYDTDSQGNYVENDETTIHLSDRNCGGKEWSSWF